MSDRAYPARPILAVGAVVLNDAGHVVLVRRGQAPLAGRWSLPGGAVDAGESVAEAIAREVAEETGLTVQVGDLIDVVEHVDRDPAGRTEYHYVILEYLCRVREGALVPHSDVDAAVFADPVALESFELTAASRRVIAKAIDRNVQ